jgi:hypothetical protein
MLAFPKEHVSSGSGAGGSSLLGEQLNVPSLPINIIDAAIMINNL